MNNSKNIVFYLFILVFFHAVGQKKASIVFKSHTANIHFVVENKNVDWHISPETNPDRYAIYCAKQTKKIKVISDIDSLRLRLKANDTIRFVVLLHDTIKANTEIIGVGNISNRIPENDKLYYLSLLWSETKYNFVNIDQLKFNIDSMYHSFIPSVLATKNDYEFYLELRRFLATMHDGHTEVSSNGQFSMFKDYASMGIVDIDKKIYITSLKKGIGIDSTFVGAEIIKIDDMPTIQYMNTKVLPYYSATTEQHRWMQGVSSLVFDLSDKNFNITVKKRNNETVTVSLKRNGEKTRSSNDIYYGAKTIWNDSIAWYKWLNDSLAYINITAFYPEEEAISQIDYCINNTRNAKELIIDLRENGGGSTEVAWRLQSYLTPGKWFLNYGWQTRINDGVKKANGNWIPEDSSFFLNKAYQFFPPDTVFVADTLKRINVPVVFLIGRYTFSAAEDFLVNVYETQRRPLLIGEETGGSTGSPLVVPNLPGDGYARICTRRICFPYSHKPFVNQGIIPDILVPQTIDAYLENRDLVLDRAIEILNRK